MIQGMLCHAKNVPAAGFAILFINLFAGGPAAWAGKLPSESAGYKSTPQLSVRVYNFAGLSPELLNEGEIEAARLLRNVQVGLNWVDCTSGSASATCMSNLAPTDLVVRVVAKALPQASANALGLAGSNLGGGIAFVFYDRILALRTHSRPLSPILGRVLAHEITHLLLPPESHSDAGLMRGHWTADDMRMDSSACMGLPVASVQLMQTEALRRAISAREQALK
jgi:hypothetical protein